MRRALCAVALFALACLLPRAASVGLAGDYVDPVGRVTAQDEALYAHSAIAMSQHGDWLTPQFMGRLALSKPPMLIWTAALSARLFGINHLTLRLPTALFAAFAIGLIFLWGAEAAGIQAGACAALLVLSNHLFHTLSTLCMTDGLLVAFTVTAMYSLYADPWLESQASLWGFAASSAAAILTKGIAGIFPLATLGLYWIAGPIKRRPLFRRAALAAGLSMLLAAPWFLYQLAVHPRWFWTEHIAVEILGYGAGTPPQTSRENPALFYLTRFTATDTVLFAACIVAIPAFFRALRRRSAGPTLLACWLSLTIAATLFWQYRNAAYLLAVIPSLALIAACYGPFTEGRSSSWMLVFVCAGVILKLATPGHPWGLSYRAGTVQPLAPALSAYCESGRRNPLMIVDFADDLYAATLPIHPPRYLITGSPPTERAYAMPFGRMGIIVTAAQFNNLEKLTPGFGERLREWGIDSADAIATVTVASLPGEFARLVRIHPFYDFLIPERYRSSLADSGHELVPAAPGYFFLLARTKIVDDAGAAWTCRL
jgi:hypothetical protein